MSDDNELPGMLAVAKGVAEQKWPHSMDAAVWAKEFMERVPLYSRAGLDEGDLIGWFANAIMAGYDTANSRQYVGREAAPPEATRSTTLEEITENAMRVIGAGWTPWDMQWVPSNAFIFEVGKHGVIVYGRARLNDPLYRLELPPLPQRREE